MIRKLKAILFFFAILLSSPAISDEKIFLTIGTAGETGVYYPTGGSICRMVNRGEARQEMNCKIEATEGSQANLEGLRDGTLDFAIVQSDILYKAYNGLGDYSGEKKMDNLRVVFSLYSEPFTLIARKNSGITGLASLKGRRVSLGTVGAGMRATTERLFKLKGWDESYFAAVVNDADQVKTFCDRRVDALVYTMGHPNSLVQKMTKDCNAVIIGISDTEIDKLVKDNPFYFPATIAGGMYQGNPGDLRTFGVKAVLVTTKETSEEVVYNLVKSIFTKLDDFKTLHPVFANMSREAMSTASAGVQLHRGSEKYFSE
jgi:hypothetical protein